MARVSTNKPRPPMTHQGNITKLSCHPRHFTWTRRIHRIMDSQFSFTQSIISIYGDFKRFKAYCFFDWKILIQFLKANLNILSRNRLFFSPILTNFNLKIIKQMQWKDVCLLCLLCFANFCNYINFTVQISSHTISWIVKSFCAKMDLSS